MPPMLCPKCGMSETNHQNWCPYGEDKMFCNITGQECVKEKCKQWNVNMADCNFRKRVSAYLYRSPSAKDAAGFTYYLEELVPNPISRSKDGTS